MSGGVRERVGKLFLVERGEGRLVLLAALFHFLVLGVNNLLTPLRDTMGLEQGVDKLPYMIWAVLGAMIVMNPPFGVLLRRLGGRKLALWAYRFGAVCLIGFGLAFGQLVAREHPWFARGFYIWVTVFNLFFVSLFWSIATDTFEERQGRRVFAGIGAAGTLGGIVGSWGATQLAGAHHSAWIPIAGAVALEAAAWCVIVLKNRQATVASPQVRVEPAGGGALDGLRSVARSPYLILICLFMFLYTFTSQFLQLEKNNIVNAAIADADGRTAFFGTVRQWVQTATLIVQLLIAGRLVAWIGVTGGLVLVPIVTCIGFAALGAAPGLRIVAGFEITRNALNYSVTRLSREVLWTVVSRVERFAAKNFIETFVYRGGDALAAGAFKALQAAATFGLPALAFVAIVPAVAWAGVAVAVGRGHRRRVAGSA